MRPNSFQNPGHVPAPAVTKSPSIDYNGTSMMTNGPTVTITKPSPSTDCADTDETTMISGPPSAETVNDPQQKASVVEAESVKGKGEKNFHINCSWSKSIIVLLVPLTIQ